MSSAKRVFPRRGIGSTNLLFTKMLQMQHFSISLFPSILYHKYVAIATLL
nr:MAG TPA: hypothetical protein [Caudoviricetes sp.]